MSNYYGVIEFITMSCFCRCTTSGTREGLRTEMGRCPMPAREGCGISMATGSRSAGELVAQEENG